MYHLNEHWKASLMLASRQSLSLFVDPRVRPVLPFGVPSRQRGTTHGDISNPPSHSSLIHRFRHILIRADDIKLPLVHFLLHVFRNLAWKPCTLWFRRKSFRVGNRANISGNCSVRPSRNKKVNSDSARDAACSQVVAKLFRDGFYRGLTGVIGRVMSAWRIRYTLL